MSKYIFRNEKGGYESAYDKNSLMKLCYEEISDLEAKLAEYEKFMKDNEWDSVKEMQETLNKCEKKYFDIQQELADRKKLCDLRYEQLQNSHQDKILFAVEQIVKTKETLIKFLQDEGFYANEWYDLFDEINNQIKQLKEGVKNE